jgi:hypothetical protein
MNGLLGMALEAVGFAVAPLLCKVRWNKVRKRHFLSHLYINAMILPRQAQDKHRENSIKCRFLAGARRGDHLHPHGAACNAAGRRAVSVTPLLSSMLAPIR